MNYAILGPRHAILNVRDTAPRDGILYVELTDEQAAQAAAIKADKKLPIWLDNTVTSREAVRASGFRVVWSEEQEKLVKVALPPPASVPLWAFRQVLIEDGLLPTILAAVQGNVVLTNFLEYGNFVDRSSPSLAAIATQLNKTSDEVDQMFRRAAALKL